MAIEALSGIRVVEIGTSVAGAYAGKLFADAGADVVLIEEAAGSPLRRLNRRGYAEHDSDDQPLFRWLAAGKRSARGPGGNAVNALLRRAHLVISELPPEQFDELQLLPDPSNVVVTISPYGRGLLQSTPGNDFTAHAISGSIAARGLPEREPIYPAGRITELGAGTFVAAGALSAVQDLLRTGRGAHIDASCAEAGFITSNLYFDLMFRMLGFVPPTPGRMVVFPGIERTADGWIGLNTNSRQKLEDLTVLVGREDLLGESDLRSDPDRKAQFEASTKAYLMQHTTEEILELATAMRIPVAPVGNGELLPTFDHFIERKIFTDELYGNTAPRPHYTLDGVRPRPRAAAPTRSDAQSPDAIAAEWVSTAVQEPTTAPTGNSDLPLTGLKVVDLTAWWAGPSATQLLAAMGADVIHIESIQVIDAMRPAGAHAFASTPDWWERSCFFLSINPNKRDITLDLSSEKGRELLLELINWADVLVENFTPRVLAGWGLTWEKLHERNPGLIMCRMPAFGLDGPWRDRVGFAQTVEQVSGLSWATGYADGPPITPNGPCDPLGGMHAAFSVLVALRQRELSGAGCLVEAPLVESALNLAAEELLEFSAFGLLGERLGNRSRAHAPQGVYRCTGDESWIALSVDDQSWPALTRVLGEPAWCKDPALATVAGRFDAHDDIDAHLSEWCSSRDVEEAVRTLTSAGIAAAPVVDHRDVVSQPLFQDRGFAEWIEHPVTGRILVTAMPFRHSRIERWLRRPAPTLGQHNHEVLSSILGLDEAAIADLEAQRIIGTRPLGV